MEFHNPNPGTSCADIIVELERAAKDGKKDCSE
jgi:hypothetical protein